MRLICFYILSLFCSVVSGQGITNDNAFIYLNGGSKIYIDGSSGHYKNQNGGQITAGSTDTILLKGNWTNNASNGVFTSNGGNVSFIGSNQSIGGSNSTGFNSVYLGGSGIKTLGVNTSVGGSYASPAGILDLTSIPLDLNGYTLIVTNPIAGSSATGAIRFSSGYILSEQNAAVNASIVKWKMGGVGNTGSHVIPFGVSGGVKIPFSFGITSTGLSDVSISTRRTINACIPDISGACNQPWTSGVTHMSDATTGADASVASVVDRWWQIDVSAATTADLTFTYQGVENTTSSPTGTLAPQRWVNPQWAAPVGTGSAGVTSGTGTVQATGISTFGTWVVSHASTPLPVELVAFDAECLNNYVKLTWATASEINNSYFIIEKSKDGIHYNFLTSENGKGTTSQMHHYSAIDSSLSNETVFYKLVQVDFDGTRFEKQILASDCRNRTPVSFKLFPNPFSGQNLGIRATGLLADVDASLKLINQFGQVVEELQLMTDSNGEIIQTLPEDFNLAAGIYHVSLTSVGGSLSGVLVVN